MIAGYRFLNSITPRVDDIVSHQLNICSMIYYSYENAVKINHIVIVIIISIVVFVVIVVYRYRYYYRYRYRCYAILSP